MQKIPRDQVLKRFQTLSESLQEMIFSEKLSDAIIKNCNLRNINERSMPIVGQLSSRVLLGYLRPELFALEIQKETGIDMEKAQSVARDLDTEIFSAVRLELKKLYPPTIQTPTVQSWMGQKDSRPTTNDQRQDTQPTTYNLQPNSQPKPKYVIPIPEKFLRPEARITNQELRITEEKQKTAPAAEPAVIRDSNFVIQKSTEPVPPTQAPQKNLQPTTYNLQPNSQPNFKPVVPLPTFIQTQFKKQDPRSSDSAKENTGSRLINDSEMKDLIGKFSTSATQKPKPTGESPYREKI